MHQLPENAIQTRTMPIERAMPGDDPKSCRLAISSETPVERWFGLEVLDHGQGSIVMDRAGSPSGLPLLWGHECDDMEALLGRVTSFEVGPDRVLRGTATFASTEEAAKAQQLIAEGVLCDVSVGYRILSITTENPGKPNEIQRATRWEPLEVSLVSVPADAAVGVGRSVEVPEPPASRGDIQPPATKAVTAEDPMSDLNSTAAPQVADTRNERAEIVQLTNLASRFGLQREAAELLGSEKSLAESRQVLMGLIEQRAAQPIPAVQMNAREAKEYSYARAILNATDRAEGNKRARGFEDEISDEIRKTLPENYASRGGILVPMSLRTAGSQLDSITSTAGVETKFTQYGGELIELLRNYAACIAAGARVMTGLNGPVTFPRQATDATVGWVAENPGSDLSATAPTFGTVTLTAKTLSGAVPFSRQLLQQSVISVESVVRDTLAAGHALAIDRAAIHGLGSSNQPTGIYRTSNINTKAMGGVPTFAKLQDMITEVATDNALFGGLGWMTTPGVAGLMAQTLVASAAGSEMIWTGNRQDGAMCGYKAISTPQVSSVMSTLVDTGGSSHGIIFGNWNDLLIGMWGAMELVVDPYSLKKQQLIEVASFQMADIAVRHPQSFCCATGATLS